MQAPAGCEWRGEDLPRYICPPDRPPTQRLCGSGVPKAALQATVSILTDFNSALWGQSLESCDLYLSPFAEWQKMAFYFLRSEIPLLMPKFVQPDLLCDVKVQWNKSRESEMFSIVQYWFFDSDSLGVVYQEGK